MISLTKKIAYGVAITGSLAVALPALLEARKHDVERALTERSADGLEPVTATLGVPVIENAVSVVDAPTEHATEPVDAAEGETPTRRETNSSLDALARLEQSLARLDTFGGAGAGRSTATRGKDDELLGEVADLELASTTVMSTVMSDAAREQADARIEIARREALDELQAFVVSMPLRGLLRGENDSVAMFGGRLVRIGDSLLPDDALVTSIDARGVMVDVQGRAVRLEIPPVKPRARTKVNQDDASKPTDEQTGGQNVDQAPAAGAAPDSKNAAKAVKEVKQP